MKPGYPEAVTPAVLAAELLAGLRAQLPPDVKLAGFEVAIGELVDVDVAALVRELRAGAGVVDVQVKRVAALYRCLDCGAEYPPEESPCPVCGSARAELVSGDELTITRAWAAPG